MLDEGAVVDILLVEDNPHDAELALRALRRHALGNRLAWVRDGAAALEWLLGPGEDAKGGRSLPKPLPKPLPKVVLLDLRLPKVDGIQVLRQLRANPTTRDLPVVVLTSSHEEEDLAVTYRLGANSFVAKPVAYEEFARTIVDLALYWVLLNRVPAPPGPLS